MCVCECIFYSNEYGGLWWEEEIAEPTVENKISKSTSAYTLKNYNHEKP